jgi:hypothetical protein
VTMKRWQTILLCAVLAGATACGGPSTDFVDPRRNDAGGGGGGQDAETPDAGPSDQDAEPGPGWPNEGDGGVVIEWPEDEPKPGECGASSFEAEKIVVQREVQVESQVTVVKPVALYVLFDKSRSMGPNNSEYAGKELWDPAVAAMKAFVNDAKSKDIGIGIQYFPKSGGSCGNGNGFKTPAVNVAPLPGNAASIAASLDAENPNGTGGALPWGGTPIEGALRGATEFCKQYQADHADEQCVSVIVTDGKPEYASGCSENHTDLANIAKAAKTAGVTTFAVGLQGADFTLLDKIAQEGGAPDCDTNAATYACNVSSGPNKLSEALGKIRDTVVKTETRTVIETVVEEDTLPCEWAIPAQPEGKIFDPDKVNVRLTSDGAETTFVRVANRSACTSNAWHFDNGEAPSRLVACPQACQNIESKQGKIDLLLGCQTLTPQ